MTPNDLRRRFPGYQLPSDMIAVYQADAGFVLSERSIVAHVEAALRFGAEIHGRERVVHWDISNGVVHVQTDRGRYEAPRLILTAGAWTRQLVPRLAQLAVPERQVLIWTQPSRPEQFRPGVFRVFNMEAAYERIDGVEPDSVRDARLQAFLAGDRPPAVRSRA